MKAFDLEAAQGGAKVRTRDGRAVRILVYDMKCNLYPLVAIVVQGDASDDIVHTYTEHGQMRRYQSSDEDLFMATTKQTAWTNVYPRSFGGRCSTEAAAIAAADKDVLATIKIEWEE